MEPTRREILESGEDFLKMRVHTPMHDYPNLEEGVLREIFAEFKIIHVHIKVTKEADDSLLFEMKLE